MSSNSQSLRNQYHADFPDFGRAASHRLPRTPKHLPRFPSYVRRAVTSKMITDAQLYSLAIFLGSAAMLLIVLYHFLEVNSEDHKVEERPKGAAAKVKA